MRIVIAGAGRGGAGVAIRLRDGGHEVTVIDRDPLVAKRGFEENGLVALVGEATDAKTLNDADVARADVVVAMLHRDADNLAVALLAKAAGARRVMVRMRDSAYRTVYESAGVQRILSEVDITVGALATAIEHEAVRHAMVLGSGAFVAFELVLPGDAWLDGRTVGELAADPTFPPSCVLAGIFAPAGTLVAPRGSSVISAGATVLLVASRAELGDVVRFFMRGATDRPAVAGAHRPASIKKDICP